MNNSTLRRWLVSAYFLFWTFYFCYFWLNLFTFDAAGNLVANHINIWGDWAAHFTMGSSMAYHHLIPTNSPFVAGQAFSYPFVSNLISALLIRSGVPFIEAFVFPSLILSLVTVWALFLFFKKWLGSVGKAVMASFLFLLNGGLGFYYFFIDVFKSENWWQTIINPPQQYTNIEPLYYRWISVIDSMIIPQRAFALGFPIALLMMWLVLKNLQAKKMSLWQGMLIGFFLGLMSILHTHSLLALAVVLGMWAIFDLWQHRKWKKLKPRLIWWGTLFATSLAVFTPLYIKFFSHQVGNSFMKWFPGWYSYEHAEVNWFWFWLKNWGVVPILALVSLVLKIKRKQNWTSFLPFFVIFALANLILFQPFIWDNTKLIVWVSLGFSALSADLLINLWQKNNWWKSPVIIAFVVSTLAGGLDAYRILRFKLHSYTMYSGEELQLADWVEENTNSDSVWLTGDNHNHWLYNLTGRQSVITFRGWLWTHGYELDGVVSDVNTMFRRPLTAEDVFDKYKVDYIVLGPNEKSVWKANETDFSQLKLIKKTANYEIYAR